jgi:hypothetical protein
MNCHGEPSRPMPTKDRSSDGPGGGASDPGGGASARTVAATRQQRSDDDAPRIMVG